MPENYKDIELKSEEVQEILSTPPKALVRSGITVVFCAILVLLFFTYLIKYPTTIEGTITLTTQEPPVEIVAFNSGRIEQLYVENKENVQKNDVLALIENTANYNDIQKLKTLLNEIDTSTNLSAFLNVNFNLQLGDVQQEFNNFILAFNELDFYNNNNLNLGTNSNLQKQLTEYSIQKNQLQHQKILLDNELRLLQDKYQTNKQLYEKGVISRLDFNQIEAELLQKQQQQQNFLLSLSNNELAIKQIKNQIFENNFSSNVKDNETLRNFKINKDLLKAKLLWWEKNFALKSPIDGYVNYNTNISQNQTVNIGDNLFSIIPPNNQIVGHVLVPLQGAGKIKIGQDVKVNLFNYPSQEFGTINGKVLSISVLPNEENFYFIEVNLPNDLTTNYKKELTFIPNMQGSAKVITDKQRIISKIFNQFKDLVKN